jgi:hypothetical protein
MTTSWVCVTQVQCRSPREQSQDNELEESRFRGGCTLSAARVWKRIALRQFALDLFRKANLGTLALLGCGLGHRCRTWEEVDEGKAGKLVICISPISCPFSSWLLMVK